MNEVTLKSVLYATSKATGIPSWHITSGEAQPKGSDIARARVAYFITAKQAGFNLADIAKSARRSVSAVARATERDELVLHEIWSELFPPEPVEEKVEFKITDVSSRYFGSCFLIWKGGEPIGAEDEFEGAVKRMKHESERSVKSGQPRDEGGGE